MAQWPFRSWDQTFILRDTGARELHALRKAFGRVDTDWPTPVDCQLGS